MVQTLDIQAIELMAARALPATETHNLSGWQLRYTPGLGNYRLNSVLPMAGPDAPPTAALLNAAEAFYRERQLPLRLQMSAATKPSDLSQALSAHGFAAEIEADVLVADTYRVLESLPSPAPFTLSESAAPTDAWLREYAGFNNHIADESLTAAKALFGRLSPSARFVSVSVDDTPIAIGLGIREGGYLGIFCLATHPAHRRNGACSLVIRSLAERAYEQGAAQLYLQVAATNLPAQTLYRRLGFVDAYRYSHWSRMA